jgi:hypothetical protein
VIQDTIAFNGNAIAATGEIYGGTYVTGSPTNVCLNSADGSASFSLLRHGGSTNYHQQSTLYVAGSKFSQDVGVCSQLSSEGDNSEAVATSNSFFTQAETNKLNTICPEVGAAVPSATKTPQQVCTENSVSYQEAVTKCQNFNDNGAWRDACIVEYCADATNKGVLGYLKADLDEMVCSNAMIAVQLCDAPLYRWKLVSPGAANEISLGGQAHGTEVLEGWYMCEEMCALDENCRWSTARAIRSAMVTLSRQSMMRTAMAEATSITFLAIATQSITMQEAKVQNAPKAISSITWTSARKRSRRWVNAAAHNQQ